MNQLTNRRLPSFVLNGAICCWVLVCFVPTGPSILYAQTVRIEHAIQQSEKCLPHSKEWMLARFALTQALAEHDLQRAYNTAYQTLVIAEQVDANLENESKIDDNYLAVANIQLGAMGEQAFGLESDDLEEETEVDYFQIAKNLIDSGASPELRCHYYFYLISHQIHHQDIENCGTLFQKYRLAAEASGNKKLILQQECLEISFLHKHSVSDEHLATLSERIQSVRELALKENASDAICVCDIALAAIEKDEEKKRQFQSSAEVHAEKSESRKLRCFQLSNAGLGLLQQNGNARLERIFDLALDQQLHQELIQELSDSRFREAIALFEQELKIAEDLKSNWFVFESQMHLSVAHQQAKHMAKAMKYFQAAKDLQMIDALPIPNREMFFNRGLVLSVAQRDLGNATFCADALAELKRDQDLVEQLDTQISLILDRSKAAAEKNRIESEKAARLAEAQFTSSQSKADFYLGLSRALSLSLLSALIGLAYFGYRNSSKRSRSKLSAVGDELEQVETELGVQIASVRRSEKLRADAEDRLMRMQRMKSLGMMAGGIAHDFNNLLAGVMCNAEIIQMNSSDEEFVRQRVDCIVRATEKCAELSQQMLAYTGKQQVVSVPTNLNDMVRKLEPIFAPSTNLEPQLVCQLASELPISKIDAAQIERVLLNLVSNAKSACETGDVISIRTGCEKITNSELDATLFGRQISDGEFAYFEVEDTGRGISKSNMERMFEPFFTDTDEGRGLGLSVVFGIVDGHQGFIRCLSTEGVGTRFRIYLPRFEQSVQQIEDSSPQVAAPVLNRPDSAPPQSNPDRTGRVLIIDEKTNMLSEFEKTLRHEGWQTTVINDPVAAIKLLKTSSPNEYRCVFLNEVLEMATSEILARIEETKLDIPVVLLQGFPKEAVRQRENVAAIIKKPFRSADVQQAILGVLKERMVSVSPVATDPNSANRN